MTLQTIFKNCYDLAPQFHDGWIMLDKLCAKFLN